MAHIHAKIKHGEKILKLRPDTVTVSSSAIVFKLGQQMGNIYLLTSGLVNWDKKIHKMTPNGWHLSISRILNGFPWLENTILHFLRLLIKVLFSHFWQHHFQLPRFFWRFWEHRFQLQKRYLFGPFMRSLETKKKVPLLYFKTSFGKVRNGWRADNITFKISITWKLKIPDFFFQKSYLFLTFNLNDKDKQKR